MVNFVNNTLTISIAQGIKPLDTGCLATEALPWQAVRASRALVLADVRTTVPTGVRRATQNQDHWNTSPHAALTSSYSVPKSIHDEVGWQNGLLPVHHELVVV